MDSQAKTVIVRILDKEFRMACRPEAEDALKEAAFYLDTKMRQIRQQGKIIGVERIAIMAGLSIANELLEMQRNPEMAHVALTDRLMALQNQIDEAIAKAQNSESTTSNDVARDGNTEKDFNDSAVAV